MRTIQATELKAKLSAILGDVERGETIIVERHGKPVGKIVPFDDDRKRREDAVQAIRDYKKSGIRTGITVEEILSARDEGRP
ncbi:MAG: type II toxin-antitoxin system Phd/YefM family antitoxin [Hyphomicrobiales bacterium]|jgi:prevent-host-death family protein|nr:type II toxin-antitoxin system Phd/YefM family antitoxin [Hyphomicrobiales bacterium]